MRLTAAVAMIKNNVIGRFLNSSTAEVGEVRVCVGWLWLTPSVITTL